MLIPVLMYHKIVNSNKVKNKYEVTRGRFSMQMKFLKDKGYQSMSIKDLEIGLSENIKPVMITFDDGLETDFTVALPILRMLGLKSIHFIPTDYIGGERYMNWKQIGILIRSGAAIHSHAKTHRKLKELSDNEITQEILISKDRIKEETGVTPNALALPLGSRPNKIKSLLEECGYRYLFNSRPLVSNFLGTERISEFGRARITEHFDLKSFQSALNPGSLFYHRQKIIYMLKIPLKKMLKK